MIDGCGAAHRADKVKEGKKLHEIVLNGGAADNDAVPSWDAGTCLRGLGALVLDTVSLAQRTAAPVNVRGRIQSSCSDGACSAM